MGGWGAYFAVPAALTSCHSHTKQSLARWFWLNSLQYKRRALPQVLAHFGVPIIVAIEYGVLPLPQKTDSVVVGCWLNNQSQSFASFPKTVSQKAVSVWFANNIIRC